jgi:hypothetical protein
VVVLGLVLGLSSVVCARPALLGTGQDGLFAIDKQANLWGTNEREGNYAQQIVKFIGKRPNFSRTVYSSSLIKNLKPKGGHTTHNQEGHVEQVWPLPNGMVLFMASVNGKSYLYKLNPNINSVGNDGVNNYKNKQAVMNVGERYSSVRKKNIHYKDIRALHERSLLVANVAGKTVLYFGEYNVSVPRVAGGAGDAVALWQSANMGDTWTKVVEWNTNGVHAVDHIHGLKQNPYNGWIYILFGDDDQEPGIVSWDGVSKAIPRNTPLAKIGLNSKYPGWRAISGSQNVRAGDIVFTKNKCVWIPDVDFISPHEVLYGQRANHDLTDLQSTSSVPFVNGLSAVIGEIDTKGVIYWASFRSDFDYSKNPPSPTETEVHLWTSTNSGLTWNNPLANPPLGIDVYNNWTSVPQNLFVSPWGELVLGGRGVIFDPSGNESGSAAYIRR